MMRRIERFLTEVKAECRRAQKIHPEMQSLHEAAAVIREEFDEFWEAVKDKDCSIEPVRRELLHIAAMCARAVNDLGI